MDGRGGATRAQAAAHGPSSFEARLRRAPQDDGHTPTQAARTVARNLPTSVLRRVLSSARDFAADSTSADAVPVFAAPALTSEMLSATFAVPAAACWTLRVI